MLAWKSFVVSLDMCEPASVPYSLWESFSARGGSAAERLMSAVAYGWVECCSDIAGCRTNFFQDKYYCLC